jgi:hypothetical protein
MNSHIHIRAYVLTDKDGEWWEFVQTKQQKAKCFSTINVAHRYAKDHSIERYQIIKATETINPSVTGWSHEVIYDNA